MSSVYWLLNHSEFTCPGIARKMLSGICIIFKEGMSSSGRYKIRGNLPWFLTKQNDDQQFYVWKSLLVSIEALGNIVGCSYIFFSVAVHAKYGIILCVQSLFWAHKAHRASVAGKWNWSTNCQSLAPNLWPNIRETAIGAAERAAHREKGSTEGKSFWRGDQPRKWGDNLNRLLQRLVHPKPFWGWCDDFET